MVRYFPLVPPVEMIIDDLFNLLELRTGTCGIPIGKVRVGVMALREDRLTLQPHCLTHVPTLSTLAGTFMQFMVSLIMRGFVKTKICKIGVRRITCVTIMCSIRIVGFDDKETLKNLNY